MSASPYKKVFYHVLGNTALASIANFFIWWALTFWVFIETESILATSVIAGVFSVLNASTALFFGAIVDHTKKKTVMLISSVVSLFLYIAAGLFYISQTTEVFSNPTSPALWTLVIILMIGCIVGNLRGICITPCVTILVPENERDKANGMVGMVNGIAFGLISVLSGMAIGFLGMGAAIIFTILGTLFTILHLITISIPEKEIIRSLEDKNKGRVDFKGTFTLITKIPGLFPFILFTTFNNFLGGVFMALMDPYGLSLVSVELWGLLLGLLSFSFIAGGLYVSKYGLGENPLKKFFIFNMFTWFVCIFFTIQPSILLFIGGIAIWMALSPIVEAIEATLIQKIIPLERQGRIVGFSQSLESAVTPVTIFLIGPLTQLFFVPFMTTGAGAELIGSWFGTGQDRAIALVFTLAGIIGVIVTLFAMHSRSAKLLSREYIKTS